MFIVFSDPVNKSTTGALIYATSSSFHGLQNPSLTMDLPPFNFTLTYE
jgi:hypothetical protein